MEVQTLMRGAEIDAEKTSAVIRLVVFLTLAWVIFANESTQGTPGPITLAIGFYGIGTILGLVLAWWLARDRRAGDFKLYLTEPGVYRVTYEELQQAGLEASSIASRAIPPGRSSTGRTPRQPTMVDSSPMPHGPPSSTMSILPSSDARTCWTAARRLSPGGGRSSSP